MRNGSVNKFHFKALIVFFLQIVTQYLKGIFYFRQRNLSLISSNPWAWAAAVRCGDVVVSLRNGEEENHAVLSSFQITRENNLCAAKKESPKVTVRVVCIVDEIRRNYCTIWEENGRCQIFYDLPSGHTMISAMREKWRLRSIWIDSISPSMKW